MTKDELKRLDDQGLAAWNKHDADAFLSLLADNFVWYDWSSPQPMRDKEAARAYFNAWMTAFSDLRNRSISQVIGDDAVASEIEFEGTNDGPLSMGGQTTLATQKKMTMHAGYIARIRDGKIIEFRTHPDVAGMMMQLGMMPTMH